MTQDYEEGLIDNGEEKQLTPQDAPLLIRILVLTCICAMQLGTYYSSDLPGAIQSQLHDWFHGTYDYTESSSSLLYSIYSTPNCVLPLFGGILIDKYLGIRKSVMLFISLIVAGQFLFSLGVSSKLYNICVLGRFIMGLGGESLGVSQNQLCVRWFRGPSLAVIFGLVLATARVGSSINFVLTPRLAKAGANIATWTAFGICVFSFVMCLLLVILDSIYSKYVEIKKTEEEIKKEEEESAFSIKDIASFPLAAWILFAICAIFYVGVIVFYQVASMIIQQTSYHFSPETATLMLAIPNFLSIICSPIFGRIIDRFGFTVYGLVLASTGMVLVQLGFLSNAYDIVRLHPALLMFTLGVFYSIAATMWTLVPAIVDKKVVSTAYGLMTSIQNISLTVFPMLISTLQGLDGIEGTLNKYVVPILIFMTCQIVSASLSTWLASLDVAVYGGRLNMSSQKRSAMDEEKEKQEKWSSDSNNDAFAA
jgi:MFS family permease